MFDSELAAKAAQFHALAAELACAVDADTSGRVAAAVLSDVLGGVRQGELATCRLVERADRTGEYASDGAASTAAFLRGICFERGQWASKRVRLGRVLADRLTATGKAWQAGDLGLEHAQVIADAVKDILDEQLVSEIESFLAGQALGLTPTELAQLAEQLREQAAPEESAGKAATKRAAQRLHLSQTLDGMWRLDGWLDSEAGLIVSRAIAAFTRKPDPADPISNGAPRRRADALVQICRHAMTHAEACNAEGGSRHTLIVGLSHQQLLDGLGTAGVDGGGTLPAATARRMACDAGIIPAVYGADSQLLDYGRKTRTISAGLRSRLVARDGGCTFPGCDRPPAWCEGHHRRHWTRGRGPTNQNNLDLLCSHHHHAVHEGGWTLQIANDPERTPWFTPPDGRPPLRGQRRSLNISNAFNPPRRT